MIVPPRVGVRSWTDLVIVAVQSDITDQTEGFHGGEGARHESHRGGSAGADPRPGWPNEAGESIRELAASTERSYGFVHRILVEAGVTLRGRGGATRNRGREHAAG